MLPLTPAVALVAGCVVAPMVLLIRLSLFAPAVGRGFFRPGTWSLQAYSSILDGHGLSILLYTVLFAMVVAATTLVTSFPIAMFVATLPRRTQVFAIVLVLLPKTTGLLANLFGLQQLLPRGDFGAVIAEASLIIPYSVLVLVVQLNSIHQQLPDAAAGLGAGPWQRFRRVTLPLSLPGLVVAGQLALIWGLGGFLGPMFLGGPDQTTLSVELHHQAFDYSRWPRASALAVMLMGTMMLVIWLCGQVYSLDGRAVEQNPRRRSGGTTVGIPAGGAARQQ